MEDLAVTSRSAAWRRCPAPPLAEPAPAGERGSHLDTGFPMILHSEVCAYCCDSYN